MITSREDFLMSLLNCGPADLRLIDDVEYDWQDVFERLDFSCSHNLSDIMSAVFHLGKDILNEAILERIGCLEDTEKTYGISDEQRTELNELKELNPFKDLVEKFNYLDTHIACVNHKAVYEVFLSKELADFAEGTGLVVEFWEE